MTFKTNIMSLKRFYFLCFLTLTMLLVACGPTLNNDNIVPSSNNDEYPAPIISTDLAVEGYPSAVANPEGTLVGLNKPILVDDTVITGYGPVGLPIQIINVTFMGEELGAGIIGADGTFSIQVMPMSGGIRIGLLANLDSIQLSNDDVVPGDEAINIPQVGYFIDSFVVR